jgi:hypothetical protein
VSTRTRLRSAIAATILIGAVSALIGALAVPPPHERQAERKADAVARDFRPVMNAYVRRTSAAIVNQLRKKPDGYPALLALTSRLVERAPQVPTRGTTAVGRERSDRYRQALASRTLALSPFVDLEGYLRTRAIPGSSFIVSARKLLRLSPAKLLGDSPIFEGAPLRDKVLPAYEKARKDLGRRTPPEGAELLMVDLRTFADDVIAMTKAGAKDIDDGKPFYFDFGTRPKELYDRLVIVESSIQREVADRVDVLTTP